jgi:hypothetical protein
MLNDSFLVPIVEVAVDVGVDVDVVDGISSTRLLLFLLLSVDV